MNFKLLFLHLREMKHYLIASCITFAVGLYLGYMESDSFMFYLNGQTDHMKNVVEGINRMGNSQWWLLAFIFANNVLVSTFMVYAGVMFGIIPLFTLISNGLFIGYLAQIAIPERGMGTFLLSVLPHGVIEIPAIILACSYGIKFGALAVKSILFLPLPNRRAANNQQFLRLLKVSLPLVLLLVMLLFSAALVESFVTYALVN
ncbi:stage II sporulation protein M [Gorillibacterium sp. sgz5001074]|uniref:stage II sporulation protein M n=1 Tax=Gorillibacterium sp. sgz5001074 TaxID=3446695 RepID=UPI003F662B58